jgi:hypothetical protein
MEARNFAPEQFRVLAGGGEIVIAGAPIRVTKAEGATDSTPLLWAVQEILDRYAGVRWLWPGDLGTYVPRRADLSVPAMDLVWQPEMEFRIIRTHVDKMNPAARVDARHLPFRDTTAETYARLKAETDAWMQHHRMGRRSDFTFGHAFGHWWEKYAKEHPDLFAVPPLGYNGKLPFPNENRVKLRLSNPKVTEFVVQEWREAGRPPFWNVCPNDGSGFDTSPETLGWDDPPGQPLEKNWSGNSKLTARYVRFWNGIITRMRQERPDVRICTYAYSRYRDAPPAGLKLAEGILVGNVFHYDSSFFEQWNGWYNAGATNMFLRPQWLLHGADAPYLPLEEIASAMQHARKHGMVGMRPGAVHGYWGATGITPYLIARLTWRPEMSKDEIVDEYCAAFGAAAPHVRQYFRYWEEFARQAAYPVANAGEFRHTRGGLYEEAVEKYNLPRSVNKQGMWYVMPYLYTDERLAPAFAMLKEAAAAVRGGSAEFRERVQFLHDGLAHFRVARDTSALGVAALRDRSQEAAHMAKFEELRALRSALTPRHVVWGESQFVRESDSGGETIPRKLRNAAEGSSRKDRARTMVDDALDN